MTRPFIANTIVLSFLILIHIQPLPLLSQTFSNLGIFDATADWGLEPEFPPKQGYSKVPGRVEITGKGDSRIYDLYGNGDKIWDLNDEGFFLYTERSGSWRISGFFEWVSRGGAVDGWEKFGLMVREEGNQAAAKNIFLHLRSGLGEPLGDQIEVQWRYQPVSFSEDFSNKTSFISEKKELLLDSPGKGVFLRLSYIEPKSLFITEMSEDGQQWEKIQQLNWEMRKAVYGIAISNQADNEQFAHGRASRIALQPAPPIATRTIKPNYFKPNELHTVEIDIYNPQEYHQYVQIDECPPPHWRVIPTQDDISMMDGKLVWKVDAVPGSTILSYKITSASNDINCATFTGMIGNQSILGDTLVYALQEPKRKPEEIHWTSWNKEDNLSDTNFRGVFITPNQKIIARNESSNHFNLLDGYSIEKIPLPHPDDTEGYFPLVLNSADQIWCVTPAYKEKAKGVYQYDNGNWKYYPFKQEIMLPYFGYSYQSILSVEKDCLLLLTEDHLLEFNSITGSTQSIFSVTDVKLQKFNNINQSRTQGVWIAGDGGVVRLCKVYEPSSHWDWKIYPFNDVSGSNNLTLPFESPNGDLVCLRIPLNFELMDDNALFCLHENTWNLVKKVPNEIVAGWLDSKGMGWFFSLWENAMMRFEQGQEEIVTDNYGNPLTASCFTPGVLDEIWISTRNGLFRHAPLLWRMPSEMGNFDQPVFSIQEDEEGGLWFASRDYLIRFEDQHYELFPIPNDFAYSTQYSSIFLPKVLPLPQENLAVTGYGTIAPGGPTFFKNYSGPAYHLWEWNTKDLYWRLLGWDSSVGDMVLSPRGSVITRSIHNAVQEFDGNERTTRYSIPMKSSASGREIIFETSKGDLWYGAGSALHKFHDHQDQSFGPQQGFTGGITKCMLETRDHDLWIGTLNGIYTYDGKQFHFIRSGVDHVNAMIQDKDRSIWVASENGIHRFLVDSWIRYSGEDGLPSNVVYSIFEDRHGKIWAGTSQGMVYYDPTSDPDPPQTMILEEENLRITPPGGDARFVFHGIDKWKYTDKDRLLFSHRVDNRPWTPFTHETIATCSGQSSGDHRFEVRAMDLNGNVDPHPASFLFTVLMPWYKNPLFLLLLAVGLGIILFLLGLHVYHHFNLESVVANRTSSLRLANHRLRLMAEELSRTEERERRQLASDLHDSISQSLSVSMIELAAMEDIPTVNEIPKYTEVIQVKLDDAFKATQNLTFDLCPPELYQVGLESAIQELTIRMQKQHKIDIAFDRDHQSKPLSDDLRYFLFRATRELLFNVVKHAHATAVRVSIQKINSHLQIQVIDDGDGFINTNDYYHASEKVSFGLFSIHERVSLLGGTVKISSKPGQGTRVTITIPLLGSSDMDQGGKST